MLVAVKIVDHADVDAERVRWINAINRCWLSRRATAMQHRLLDTTDAMVAKLLGDRLAKLKRSSHALASATATAAAAPSVDASDTAATWTITLADLGGSCDYRQVKRHLEPLFPAGYVASNKVLLRERLRGIIEHLGDNQYLAHLQLSRLRITADGYVGDGDIVDDAGYHSDADERAGDHVVGGIANSGNDNDNADDSHDDDSGAMLEHEHHDAETTMLAVMARQSRVLFHSAASATAVCVIEDWIAQLKCNLDAVAPLTDFEAAAVFHAVLSRGWHHSHHTGADGPQLRLTTSELPLLVRATDWTNPYHSLVARRAIASCQAAHETRDVRVVASSSFNGGGGAGGDPNTPASGAAPFEAWAPPDLAEVLQLLHPSSAGCSLLREYGTQRLLDLALPSSMFACVLPQLVHSFRWESIALQHVPVWGSTLADAAVGSDVSGGVGAGDVGGSGGGRGGSGDSKQPHRQYNALHAHVLARALQDGRGIHQSPVGNQSGAPTSAGASSTSTQGSNLGLALFWLLHVETSARDDSLQAAGIRAVEHRAFCGHLLQSLLDSVSSSSPSSPAKSTTSLRALFDNQRRLWGEHGLFAHLNDVVQRGSVAVEVDEASTAASAAVGIDGDVGSLGGAGLHLSSKVRYARRRCRCRCRCRCWCWCRCPRIHIFVCMYVWCLRN